MYLTSYVIPTIGPHALGRVGRFVTCNIAKLEMVVINHKYPKVTSSNDILHSRRY